MERGETVVAVTIAEREAETVIAVLEDHSPLSLDEQAEEDEASEEDDSAETSERARAGTRVESERISRTPSRATGEREEVIPLAEEELQVGKRTVSRGTTRVRRYVVESPVEQTVSLREERVVVEKRRPATDEVTGDAFTDKTVEVTETSEVPVTEKVARLKEEVVVRRQGTERTEKVRDTVRRDQMEVEDADETPAARRRSNA